MRSAAVSAFEDTHPWVEQLTSFRGPYEPAFAKKLNEVIETLWDKRGKRLRPHLVYWFGKLFQVKAEDLSLYAWAAEAVHTATLLHDDVIDEASLRRGGPSANCLYDNTLPILAGDYLISDVIYQLASKGDRKLLCRLSQTLRDLCSGECLQYELRYTIPPRPDFFHEIVKKKTTSLFYWCALVGPVLAKASFNERIFAYIEPLGLLFQMSDDLLDVVGTRSKDSWNDLKEGRLNFVTWRIVQADATLKEVVEKEFYKREGTNSLASSFKDSPFFTAIVDMVRKELTDIASLAEKAAFRLPSSDIRSALTELPYLLVDRCL